MTVGSVTSGRVVVSSNILTPTTVNPVQQLLNTEKAATTTTTSTTTSGASASDPTDYQDQSWFIEAQVTQLKGELATYEAVPGLDPSGSIQDELATQVNTLVAKVQAQEKAAQASQAAAQAQLTQQQQATLASEAYPSVTELLQRAAARASGQAVGVYVAPTAASTAAASDTDTNIVSVSQMLTDAAAPRGSTVNTTA
jgi:hypothetical protein